MHAHGVEVLVGTDAGNPYVFSGFSVHDELELLVEAGPVPRRPRSRLAREAPRLKPASDANLVVLDGNPLKDIRNTQRIHTVLTRGRVLGPAERQRDARGRGKGCSGTISHCAEACC